MKQRFYGLFAVLTAFLLTVTISASAGMYTYDPSDGEYWSAELNMLDKTAVSLWMEDGTAAGYNDPNYTDTTGVSYLEDMSSGWYEVVLCGLGSDADDFPAETDGKVAFCIRGDSTFTIKAENAETSGAIACIVGNNCRNIEEIDENGIVTSRKYENITMNLDRYTVPAATLSSDVTVRLVAETADVTIAEAVAAVTEVYNGAFQLGLEHQQTARVFLGTAAQYAEATADDEIPWETYENIQWYFDETTGTLTLSGEGAVPDSGNWNSYTKYPWYKHYEDIETLVLEEGITALTGNAFYGCGITEVQIPASMETFNASMFQGANMVQNFHVTEGGKYYDIDGVLYSEDGDTVTAECYPFGRKEVLDSYEIPEGVTHIAERAFNGARIVELVLPDSLTNIGLYSICNNYFLETLYIPENVSYIHTDAFSGLSSLKTITAAGENTCYQTIDNVLYDTELTTLYLYPQQKTVKEYTVPEGVTVINSQMIGTASYLETVYLPSTLRHLYVNQYSWNCTMKAVHINENNPYLCSVDGVVYNKEQTKLLYYPCSKDNTVYRMPDTVTKIDTTFYGVPALEEIHMSKNLSSLDWWNIQADNLTSMYFYTGVPSYLTSARDEIRENVTMYYIEGQSGWTSPTYTAANGNVFNTAVFVPAEDDTDDSEFPDNMDIPWETYENIYWYFHEPTGILALAGEGALPDVSSSEFPWSTSSSKILTVIVKEDITELSGEAISSFGDNLAEITLPPSLTSVDTDELSTKAKLSKVTVWGENEQYHTEDGILYSKDMTALLVYPAMHPNTSYAIPDSVTTAPITAFLKTVSLETLTIPASVTEITNPFYASSGENRLKEILVAEDNPNFCSKNGILYTKDMRALILYPPDKADTVYRMPDTVTFIWNHAFARLKYVEDLHFSPNLTDWNLMGSIFSSTPKLTSLYYYCDYIPMMSAPFMSLYMSGRISKVTLYYIEGKSGWTTPTLNMGFVTAKTATFVPEDEPEELPWETYENILWYFDEETGTLTIGGEGAIPDVNPNKYPWYPYSSQLLSIVIEEGVTELRSKAINSFGYNFTEIHLPATLTTIETQEISWKYNLTTITVAEDNERYYMKDGVLFEHADDGIHLLIYPQTKKDITSYTVPDGVTSLDQYSIVSNSTLTELILPDSLEVIEDRSIQLWGLDTLHIPANVKEISPSGIICANLTELTLDSENTAYTLENGILFTKDMTELTVYPANHPNTSYTVPDTVTSIPSSLFHQTSNLETLNIDASVAEIVDIHFYSLGNSQLKAIQVDENNPNFCDKDGILYTKDMTTLLFYPPCKEDTVYRMPDTVTDMDWVAMNVLFYLEELHLSPVIDSWYDHYNFCNFAPALTSVYFYERYYAGIAEAFRSLYYDSGLDNLTFYYLEGMNGWTSPTMSFGYADVNTAAFQLNPEDFGDLPWQVFQNILWYFDEETAALHLGGYGQIPELKDPTFYPWYMAGTTIEHLYIMDGITGLNSVFLNPKWCDFYSVRLPATLESFATTPFQSSANLEAFTMEKTNTNFYVEDGVLYLKNGSEITFMCYPAGKKDKSYTLPEGLTRIPSYGMWADALEEIILPESLVRIDNRAFSSVNLTSIHIPANANDIRRVAFLTATELESITVDPKNETYTSVDGVLYTKDMKLLHTYPIKHTAADYTVPEGVLEIPIEIITGGENIKTLNLPASLEVIYTGGSSFNYYCTLEEIHVDADNPYFSSTDGVMYNKAGTELLYYPVARTNAEFRIPDSVKVIGKYAFRRTVHLETLYVGANLKEANSSVAQRADSLSAVYFPAGVPAYLNDLLGKYYNFNQTILYYPEGAEGWTEEILTVDDFTYRTAPYTIEYVPGDLTGDGIADANDVLVLAMYFAGYTDTGLENLMGVLPKSFDGNPDDFSRYDAMYLARALAGWDGYNLP